MLHAISARGPNPLVHSYAVFTHMLLFVKVSYFIPPSSHFLTFLIILFLINTENVALRAPPAYHRFTAPLYRKSTENPSLEKIWKSVLAYFSSTIQCRWHCVISFFLRLGFLAIPSSHVLVRMIVTARAITAAFLEDRQSRQGVILHMSTEPTLHVNRLFVHESC